MQQVGLVETEQKPLHVAETGQARQLHLHGHHSATTTAATAATRCYVEFLEPSDLLGQCPDPVAVLLLGAVRTTRLGSRQALILPPVELPERREVSHQRLFTSRKLCTRTGDKAYQPWTHRPSDDDQHQAPNQHFFTVFHDPASSLPLEPAFVCACPFSAFFFSAPGVFALPSRRMLTLLKRNLNAACRSLLGSSFDGRTV